MTPELEQLHRDLVTDGFVRYRCGPRDAPMLLLAYYEWPGYIDLVTIRTYEQITAARVPKPVDVFAPRLAVWAYQGPAEPTLRALLRLMHPAHPGAPTQTFPAPPCTSRRTEQRPLAIRLSRSPWTAGPIMRLPVALPCGPPHSTEGERIAVEPIIDPQLYERPDLRTALAAHQFGPVFDALNTHAGLSYREIGRRTGTHESVIYEIRKGRAVEHYAVLVRIAEGLTIPRHLMGIGTAESTYPGQVTVADPEGAEKMLRRHLLALGGVAVTGATVTKLGVLLAELPGPPPVSLPTQLDPSHIAQVRDLTRRLGEADNGGICAAEVLGGAAAWAGRLLDVPGPDPLRTDLMTAVAELHIEAGWSAFDAGLYRRTLYHYARSLDLANLAGDAYLQALALNYAGMASIEHGHPDDGLKMLQLGLVRAWHIPRDNRRAVVVGENGRAAVEATVLADTASALAGLGDLAGADTALATARELWSPASGDPYGDLYRPAARLALRCGRLDRAEAMADASLRRWKGGSRISRTQTGIVQATIHVTAGEPRGLVLAHDAVSEVRKLGSARVRAQLLPLAEVLESRPGSDARDLARQARQIATTRA